MISYPAPALCQGADEDLMIEIGEIVFPDCIKRWPGENGLRVWVDGDGPSVTAAVDARARFQTILGVLRAWRPRAGGLRDEERAGLGEGAVRDESGNQWVAIGCVNDYRIAGGEIRSLAESARLGILTSQYLRNSLWLNGRANRTSADYYMVHEYAMKEFHGTKGICEVLGLSVKSQRRLTQSADNLSPLEGGRHAKVHRGVPMTLDSQRQYVGSLLRLWIEYYKPPDPAVVLNS